MSTPSTPLRSRMVKGRYNYFNSCNISDNFSSQFAGDLAVSNHARPRVIEVFHNLNPRSKRREREQARSKLQIDIASTKAIPDVAKNPRASYLNSSLLSEVSLLFLDVVIRGRPVHLI